jgi:hypothetical protein
MRWDNFLSELGSMRASPCGPSRPAAQCLKKGGAVKKFGKGGMLAAPGAGPAPAGASPTFSSSGPSSASADTQNSVELPITTSKQEHLLTCAYPPVKAVGKFYGTRPPIPRFKSDSKDTTSNSGPPARARSRSRSPDFGSGDSFETRSYLDNVDFSRMKKAQKEKYRTDLEGRLDSEEASISDIGPPLGVRIHPGESTAKKIRKQIKKQHPVLLTTKITSGPARGAPHTLTAAGHSRKAGIDFLKVQDPLDGAIHKVEYEPSKPTKRSAASSTRGQRFKGYQPYEVTGAWRTRPKP